MDESDSRPTAAGTARLVDQPPALTIETGEQGINVRRRKSNMGKTGPTPSNKFGNRALITLGVASPLAEPATGGHRAVIILHDLQFTITDGDE